MIPTFFAALTLVLAPQQAPDLTTLVRVTLEQCAAGHTIFGIFGRTVEVADADWARPFRNDRECGLMAEGWTGDHGALVAAARAAVGAEGPDWTGVVRESRVNESAPALWTQLEQAEGWAPASLRIIEPPAGQTGPVEIHFSRAG
jgi:hypothetical protein